jgi:hypothetical protein
MAKRAGPRAAGSVDLAAPARLWHIRGHAEAPKRSTALWCCCRSSVVEHSLGKGEVVCSIHTGSTRTTGRRPRQQSQPAAPSHAWAAARPLARVEPKSRSASATAKRSGAKPRSPRLTLSARSGPRARVSVRSEGVTPSIAGLAAATGKAGGGIPGTKQACGSAFDHQQGQHDREGVASATPSSLAVAS